VSDDFILGGIVEGAVILVNLFCDGVGFVVGGAEGVEGDAEVVRSAEDGEGGGVGDADVGDGVAEEVAVDGIFGYDEAEEGADGVGGRGGRWSFGGAVGEASLFDSDEIPDIEAGDEFFCQRGGKGMVRRERGVEGFDGLEYLVGEVAECEDVFVSGIAEEEADADAVEEEVERFTHVVDRRDSDAEVGGDGREMGCVAEEVRAVESEV
jgi:hypothetical protein